MSQRILNHLDVHARFAHPGREGMPQGMRRKMGQLKRGRSTVLFGFFASTSSLQSRMMRRMALFSVP